MEQMPPNIENTPTNTAPEKKKRVASRAIAGGVAAAIGVGSLQPAEAGEMKTDNWEAGIKQEQQVDITSGQIQFLESLRQMEAGGSFEWTPSQEEVQQAQPQSAVERAAVQVGDFLEAAIQEIIKIYQPGWREEHFGTLPNEAAKETAATLMHQFVAAVEMNRPLEKSDQTGGTQAMRDMQERGIGSSKETIVAVANAVLGTIPEGIIFQDFSTKEAKESALAAKYLRERAAEMLEMAQR